MKIRRAWIIAAAVLAVASAGVGVAILRSRPAPLTADQAYDLGQKQMAAGYFREAYQHFQHAARLQPGSARNEWAAAQAALKLGLTQAAEGHAREAWSGGLKNRDVFLLQVSAITGDHALRLKRGLAWLKELPDTPERRELEGDLLQSSQRPEESIRIWTDLYATHPTPSLANKIALTHVAVGRPERAEEFLKSLIEGGGLDEEGFSLLASLAAYRGDAEEAASVFAAARARYGTGEALKLSEGVFLIWSDRVADAATLLASLVESPSPGFAGRAQARIFLGFIRGVQKDGAALESLSKLATGEGAALEGERLYYRGLKDGSVDVLKKSRQLLPSHPACDWALARELARAGAWKESVESYRRVYGLLAGAPVLQVELARALGGAGQVDEALDVLRRVHARRYQTRASLEMLREFAALKGLRGEAAEAQELLEKHFRNDPAVELAGGMLAAQLGNLSEAASILDALAARHPGRDDVDLARISLLFSRKDYPGVIAACDSSKAPAASLAPMKAAALVMLGRSDEALAHYERILSARPEPWALLSYANLLLRLERHSPAAEAYSKLLGMDPGNSIARLGLASIAIRSGKWKEARDLATAALTGATQPAALVLIAEIELEEGRPDRAAAACKQALGSTPKDERALFLLGVATLNLGRAEEARAQLRPLASARPEAAHIQWQLARACLAAGALDEALALVDASLAKGPASTGSFRTMRFAILVRQRRGDEARAELSRLGSDLAPAVKVLCEAWLYHLEGRNADAMARLRDHLRDPHAAVYWAELKLAGGDADGVLQALEPHALDAARWGRLGEMARVKGFLPEAAHCYRRALRHEPGNPQLLNNFAYASLQLPSINEAEVLEAAKKVHSLLPGNASVLHTYAAVMLRCRKDRECLEQLAKYPALVTGSARLLHARATAHERLEQWSRAIQDLEACLAFPETDAPSNGDLSRPAVKQKIEYLRSKSNSR